EPAVTHGKRAVDHSGRLAGPVHLTMEREPVVLQIGDEFAYSFAHNLMQAGVIVERWVGRNELEIIGRVAVPVQEFDDAKAFIHRFKKRTKSFFAAAESVMGANMLEPQAHAFRDVAEQVEF